MNDLSARLDALMAKVNDIYAILRPSSCVGQPDGPITLWTASGTPYSTICIAGYVLLAKLDGSKRTWGYDSQLWNTSEVLNADNINVTDFNTEAKSHAFNLFAVTSVRVGMTNSFTGFSGARWVDVPLGNTYPSLLALMTNDFQATSIGRTAWKALAGSSSSLQYNCNHEGFNVYPSKELSPSAMHTRIGIVANNEDGCVNPDSVIGFGISDGQQYTNGDACWCYTTLAPTVGNFAPCAPCSPDNGEANLPTFGYILGA